MSGRDPSDAERQMWARDSGPCDRLREIGPGSDVRFRSAYRLGAISGPVPPYRPPACGPR